jgi:hypothetical protein
VTARFSENGIGGLKPEERVRLPGDLKPAAPAYRGRLRPISAMHGKMSQERFRRFVDVQLLRGRASAADGKRPTMRQ